jgi:hypothetical protein
MGFKPTTFRLKIERCTAKLDILRYHTYSKNYLNPNYCNVYRYQEISLDITGNHKVSLTYEQTYEQT